MLKVVLAVIVLVGVVVFSVAVIQEKKRDKAD